MPQLSSKLLSWATAGLFIGYAWIGVFFDFPFREVLWNEALISPLLSVFQIDWTWWVSAEGINAYLPGLQMFLSLLLVLGFIGVVWSKLPGRRIWISTSAILVLLILLLGWPGHNHTFGYLLEIALRGGTPFLWLTHRGGKRSGKLYTIAKWLIAATFIGHGLYALNFYPRPGSFVNWTSAGLGLSESASIQVLNAVGILDLVAAALLLLPKPSWSLPVAMIWLIPWGFLTTTARLWSNSAYEEWTYLFLRWTPEVLIRLPHVLVVIAVYLAWKSLRQRI